MSETENTASISRRHLMAGAGAVATAMAVGQAQASSSDAHGHHGGDGRVIDQGRGQW